MLVVPPFRGLDEHDHAYKAASVARGDWSAHHPASPQGWGEFVVVPRGLVLAAQPVCEALPYTEPDNCRPGRSHGDGQVEVASSASRYNPAFYTAIGTPARLFSGAQSLYAMRAAAALICALLVAGAVATTRSWSRSSAPAIGVLLALTPVMLYSTAVAAPNGVEMAAAMLVWTALLGIARRKVDPGAIRRYAVVATVGALPLVTVRTLGPLWLLLILGSAALLLERRTLGAVSRSRPARVGAAAVFAAALASAAWTLVAGTNSLGEAAGDFDESLWVVVPLQAVLWLVQSIAAFPARDEIAPLPLYGIALIAWWVWAATAARFAGARERLVLLAVCAGAFLVPALVTVMSYSTAGTLWQGRYGFPLAMGFLLVCGYVLDERFAGRRRLEALSVVVTLVVLGTIQLIGQLAVLFDQRRSSPLAGSSAWLEPSTAVVVVLSVAGVAALGRAATRDQPTAVAVTHRSRMLDAAPESTASRARSIPVPSDSATSAAPAS